MNAFRNELCELVAKHVALAPAPRILSLVEQLAGETAPRVAVGGVSRFVKIAADGSLWMDPQDGEHVATYDRETGLTHLAAPVDCGDKPWAEAIEAAKKVRVFGATDWRAPTVKELISIIDYERCDPAVDPEYFKGPYEWTWTATPAKSPSDFAWYVFLGNGYVSRGSQSLHGQVRAVRAGQPLGLGL